MYISQDALHRALIDLENVQPFYGITFLVCKNYKLPIGNPVSFPISQLESDLLNRYYRPIPESIYFFRVFRPSDKNKFWLEPNYPSTGSQSNRTQKFGQAFNHPKKSDLWSWSKDYVKVLQDNLQNGKKIPLHSLAIWLYRDYDWDLAKLDASVLGNSFIQEFSINNAELDALFEYESNLPIEYMGSNLWSDERYSWGLLKNYFSIPVPTDSPIEQIRSLQKLHIENIGPAQEFDINFGKGLNIFTGDNGLGKTFILELIWWALTGTWTSDPIYPNQIESKFSGHSYKNPLISFELEGINGTPEYYQAYFSRLTNNWQRTEVSSATGLVIYARADGLFAVMDPSTPQSSPNNLEIKPIIFRKEDVWEGISSNKDDVLSSARGYSNRICNGLLVDWINWQQADDESFELLIKVLERLSPPDTGDLGKMSPGKPARIFRDSRLIPTVKHSYGEIPVLYASDGVKRVLALAYLIVWTWQEHKFNAATIQESPLKNLVFIIDEVEINLHPQWQRRILPALLEVFKDLDLELSVQFMVSSHSPIVLSSIENQFDEDKDKLYHLDIIENNHRRYAEVIIKDIDFEKRGTIDSWLTSQIFELKEPRGSLGSEDIISKAVKLQLEENISRDKVLRITQQLLELLPPHDKFWVRWRSFASRYDVEV
ncbi:AAA family ATPase [Spirosoma agri]|uniref:AAA family ATPase n=1 Tax=Spirosoma agri TaxID=1987381 RepID=A0A6M0IHY2_9BACT|nr:ATP-binding protein [Spirosoma agri]NEU67794.1 AAA family ATPase [Spirosoma agri]